LYNLKDYQPQRNAFLFNNLFSNIENFSAFKQDTAWDFREQVIYTFFFLNNLIAPNEISLTKNLICFSANCLLSG